MGAIVVAAGVVAAVIAGWLLNRFRLDEVSPWAVGVGLVLCLALAGAGPIVATKLDEADEGSSTPSSFVGGCGTFALHAQNQYLPYGAAGREQPSRTSRKVASFEPNEIISVDGWVIAQPGYPTNPEPLNSGAWYHLADDSGWVGFAAVRANPTSPDPDTHGVGSFYAPLDEDCRGSVR